MAALQEAQERLQSSVSSLQVRHLSCTTLCFRSGRSMSRQAPHSPAYSSTHYSMCT